MYKFSLKEKQRRGMKDHGFIVLPEVPQVGRKFYDNKREKEFEVLDVSINLWPSGDSLVIELAESNTRPFGTLLLAPVGGVVEIEENL
jgi:hypothetical protein